MQKIELGQQVKASIDWNYSVDYCFVCGKKVGKNAAVIYLDENDNLTTAENCDFSAGAHAEVIGSSCMKQFDAKGVGA